MIAKNEVKTDPDVEFSWIGEINLQNQRKFKLGYSLFLETSNAITMPDCVLTDLPYVRWLRILNFLTSFDIFNLYFSSKKFITIILSTKYSSVFKLMDRVCDEEIWVDILSRNFSDFLTRLRDKLKNDLEIYFFLSNRFHSFIFNNLSLYSVFVHFILCKSRCDKKEPYERFCNFV